MSVKNIKTGSHYFGIAAAANVDNNMVMLVAENKKALDKAWGKLFAPGKRTDPDRNKKVIVISQTQL